VILLMISKKHC